MNFKYLNKQLINFYILIIDWNNEYKMIWISGVYMNNNKWFLINYELITYNPWNNKYKFYILWISIIFPDYNSNFPKTIQIPNSQFPIYNFQIHLQI